jgi:hypothetical protein
MNYLFKLDRPFSYESPHLRGISFENEWIRILPIGRIEIAAGYAWDGCSPKLFLSKFYLGTPDGPIMSDGLPQTAWASLVHDALCQFRLDIPITKDKTVLIFDEMLRKANWKLRPIYTFAVNHFGPQQFGAD